MEQHPEQQQQAEQQEQRDWASLPGDLLRICLSAAPLRGDKPSSYAALATCKAFARALVHTSLQALYWNLDRSLLPRAQLLEALWDGEQHEGKGLRALMLASAVSGTPGRCVAQLLDAHVRLSWVRHLRLQGLSLDVLIPSGIGVLLPNLEALTICQCQLTPVARTTVLDAACSRLFHIEFLGVSAGAPGAAAASSTTIATAQLKQLAKLSSLSAVVLADSSCPTLFLLALGTRLTHLHLDSSYHQYLPNTLTPTPGWKATLQHVARCTRLEHLTIPCHTAEDLGLVAPALQQLGTLCLNSSWDAVMAAATAVDGDAMMEVLLGLPHLRGLRWDSCVVCRFQRRYTASQHNPCWWEELVTNWVSAHSLARLPLRSVKRPFVWHCLLVDEHSSRQDVRAAVANVTRCPGGFAWQHDPGVLPSLAFAGARTQHAVAEILVALQPLLTSLARLHVGGLAWDVELVKVLGQVLPRTCTWLALVGGGVSRGVLEQIASSLSWLATLHLLALHVSPLDVVQYVRTARSSTRGVGAAAQPALRAVKVMQPERPEGMSEVQHKWAWDEAVREVQRVSKGTVVLSVML